MSTTTAARLRYFMKREGVSQAALARRLKVSESAVSQWMVKDGTEPTLRNLRRIMKALRVRDEQEFFAPLPEDEESQAAVG